MQYTVDHALIQEPVDNILGEPIGRLDEDPIIELVKVIFVLEQWDLEPVFCKCVDIAICDPTKVQATQRHKERREKRYPVEFHGFGMLCQRSTDELVQPVRE